MSTASSQKISLSFVSVLALTFALQASPVLAMHGKDKDTSEASENSESFDRYIDYYYENPFEFEYMYDDMLPTVFKDHPKGHHNFWSHLRARAAQGDIKANILHVYTSPMSRTNVTPLYMAWPMVLEWLKSQKDDPHALTWLGQFARQSCPGLLANFAEAEQYYLRAIEQGHLATHLGLAQLYAGGVQEDSDSEAGAQFVDEEKAKASYLLIPDRDNPFLKVIDDCYEKPGARIADLNIDEDEDEENFAFPILLKAEAEKGNPKAKVMQFYSSLENEEDYPAVHEWLTSQQDDCFSLIWRGILSETEWSGHPADTKTAEEYYNQAINKVGVQAIKTIADFYASKEQPKALEKAEQYYLLAEAQNPKWAHRKIAKMYWWAEADQPEYKEKAKYHFLLASEKGCASSSYQLAQIYQHGPRAMCGGFERLPIDIENAKKFYTLAAEQGHPSAYQLLAHMYRYGPNGQPINVEKVEKYWLLAAKQEEESIYDLLPNQTSSYAQLAQMYHYGPNGQPIDIEKAEKYYLYSS